MRLLLAARLSRKPRGADDRDGLGIETQDKRSRQWAEREGHTVIAVAADTKSGTVAPWDRKNLRPWVTNSARLALYDGILAYKTDRLSRGDQEDFTRIEHWATENGKALVIADGPQYPARGDSDYWQWAATKREARRELESIRERTGRAQSALREQGHVVGRAPFGYAIEGKKYAKRLVSTEVGRAIVPAIYAKAIDGISLAVIAEWLNSESVRTAEGNDWSAKRIAALIRNPVYRGHRVNSAGVTEHKCPALVDADVWTRANRNLDARPGRGKRPATVNAEALLKSVLRCPKCDGPMYRLFTGTNRAPYYRCAGKGAVRRSSCQNMVRAGAADEVVSGFMATLSDEIMTLKIVPGNNHEAEIADVKAEMRELAARDLDDETYDAELARLRAERDRLRALPVTPDVAEYVSTGETYSVRWAKLTDDERGEWLRSVGLTVWIIREDNAPRGLHYGGRKLLPGMMAESGGDLPGRIMVTRDHGLFAIIAWNSAKLGGVAWA
jgi:DNA invertase Pin-like site-specific DNA recombinase